MSKPLGNLATGLILTGIVIGMVGLSFAAVPLYRMFCQVTGIGGTTQRGEVSSQIIDREMTVRFNTDVSDGLPWEFAPEQRKVTAKVGENVLVYFRAKNMSDKVTHGTATFNITPFKGGSYFVKTQCFCFDEQTLQPNEEVEMPVTFHIDPSIMNDHNMREVSTMTLSYTLFPANS